MHLTIPTLTVITAAAVALTGCGGHTTHPDQRNPSVSIRPVQIPVRSATATSSSGLPATRSPATRAATITADPALTTPSIPSPVTATASAISVARAWAIAANSSSYRDRAPGAWVTRARPFVAGAEAGAEARERTGGGGSTWAQIRSRKCVTAPAGLTAAIPSDAPTGPTAHIVFVSATVALHCADNTVRLTPYAVQLIVHRISGRWLVTESTY